jgi:hypothetical protein
MVKVRGLPPLTSPGSPDPLDEHGWQLAAC